MGNLCGKIASLACKWLKSKLRGNELITPLNTNMPNELSSNLWARLPGSLEEEILARLPISSLSPSCRVCKRWRDLILFSKVCPRFRPAHGRLVYFSSDKRLCVFSPRWGTWDTVSLCFLPLGYPDSLIELVMSDGGLLCFNTYEDGVFIVCNPLTKWYRRLQVPRGEASKMADQHFIPSPQPDHRSFSSSRIFLLVGMVVDSDTGHFKLIVGGLHQESQGTTLVFDSRADSWKKVGHIPDSVVKVGGNHCLRSHYLGLVKIPLVIEKLVCRGNLYFHFEYCGGMQIFVKYDVETEVWNLVNLPSCGFRNAVNNSCNIIQHNGKVLVVIPTKPDLGFQLLHEVTCDVWELQDVGSESHNWEWTSAHHLPFSGVLELMHYDTRVTCLGQGDVRFYITRSIESCLWRKKPSAIREWFHDVLTSSDVISNWEYIAPDLHYAMDFQIFAWSTGTMRA